MAQKQQEHVIIIGGGVVGLTSAYELLKHGYKVTLLEKEPDVALGTSHANGAQLSYSFVDAMSSPGLIKKIPSVLAGQDAALKFQWQLSMDLNIWGARFLYNGLPFNEEKNSEQLFRLSLFSRESMESLRKESDIEFSFRQSGKLVAYQSSQALEEAKHTVERKAQWGYKQSIFTVQECLEKEPALKHIGTNLVGGLFSDIDDIGDAEQYCHSILALLRENHAFDAKLGCEVLSILSDADLVTGVETQSEKLLADKIVLAAGHGSGHLLKPLGISLPIYPVQGYSLTFPAVETSPNVSITDIANKFVIGRIGDKVRVAGFADFVTNTPQGTKSRVDELLRTCRARFPDAADYTNVLERWEGSRPCTPSSMPLIDKLKLDNLYANTGHGMYGWTLAAGSARLLADRMTDGELWQQYGGISCQDHFAFRRK
ncbi:FAD-dependent oxidoreductase [Vibrio nigripulchritudo]|uniref:FAD-dependent oxidoreductase n=1 Tax=Vibrio nigripulchritudo TaxID=28173 RepID=UPI0003B23068|nr:FAD-dependent oxidoreductase [Vibrio nigripulchritudo]CCN73369.1 putative D-amino acid dehydrogenase [Vibrio nigripulchritudo SFn118]